MKEHCALRLAGLLHKEHLLFVDGESDGRVRCPGVRNRARCKECGDVIESCFRHDFRRCSCMAIAVDGGYSYVRRCGDPDSIEELP